MKETTCGTWAQVEG